MPLLSSHQSSGSGLQVSLHPLVLLTVSDYITRHTLRNSPLVIVGALIGQQSGRNITLEYAFECKTVQSEHQPEEIILDDDWFKERLQQYKDVHKDPPLELMGWFTTAPKAGPELVHVPIHQQITQNYNETAVLLSVHPQSVLDGPGVGGKLPLTIYESVYEAGEGAERGGMEVDGEGQENNPLELRFREIPYSVETGEAEMIGIDFVARGGGNATAIEGGVRSSGKGKASQTETAQTDAKGKGVQRDPKPVEEGIILSAEDEELIASLTARANAVKMLHTRINLLKSYLVSLPPSYLTQPNSASNSDRPNSGSNLEGNAEVNHSVLRSISSLLSRLPLLTPATPDSLSEFKTQSLAEKSDVELVSLLGALGSSIKDTKELGRKFGVVEAARVANKKAGMMGPAGRGDAFGSVGAPPGMADDFGPAGGTRSGGRGNGYL